MLAYNETEAIGAKAIGPMVEKFAGLSTVEAINAVDCVSGATMTSEGIKQAVINALAESSDNSEYTYDLSELFGVWEDTVYVMPAPAMLTIAESSAEQCVDVTYVLPGADELYGTLKMDDDGDLYVDMVSMYSDNNNPSFRLYLFYDGEGIGCLQNYIGGEQYMPYFERF